MHHSFDIDLAEAYGILEAILLNHFQHWIKHNAANEKHYHDGRYWTFNTVKAFAELFPYASAKQIRTAIDKLIKADIIMTGNYNKTTYDRTLWYTFTDKGLTICPLGKMDVPKKENGCGEKGTPIPNTITNTNTIQNNKENNDQPAKPSDQELLNEFEDLWHIYPRKQGKAKALEAYKRARKAGVDKTTVLDGITRYNAQIKANKTKAKYIMQGSTWFNGKRWEDEFNDQPASKPKTKQEQIDQDYIDYLNSLG